MGSFRLISPFIDPFTAMNLSIGPADLLLYNFGDGVSRNGGVAVLGDKMAKKKWLEITADQSTLEALSNCPVQAVEWNYRDWCLATAGQYPDTVTGVSGNPVGVYTVGGNTVYKPAANRDFARKWQGRFAEWGCQRIISDSVCDGLGSSYPDLLKSGRGLSSTDLIAKYGSTVWNKWTAFGCGDWLTRTLPVVSNVYVVDILDEAGNQVSRFERQDGPELQNLLRSYSVAGTSYKTYVKGSEPPFNPVMTCASIDAKYNMTNGWATTVKPKSTMVAYPTSISNWIKDRGGSQSEADFYYGSCCSVCL
jgi:hypothetical protein